MDEGFGLTEMFHKSLGHTLKGQIQVSKIYGAGLLSNFNFTLSYFSNETVFLGTLKTDYLNYIVIYYNLVKLFQRYRNISRC